MEFADVDLGAGKSDQMGQALPEQGDEQPRYPSAKRDASVLAELGDRGEEFGPGVARAGCSGLADDQFDIAEESGAVSPPQERTEGVPVHVLIEDELLQLRLTHRSKVGVGVREVAEEKVGGLDLLTGSACRGDAQRRSRGASAQVVDDLPGGIATQQWPVLSGCRDYRHVDAPLGADEAFVAAGQQPDRDQQISDVVDCSSG
ncbi:hypothetical protein C5C57_16575 [Rathayibacter sp. AY1C5]|nr:hypothetical protein C5C57_16575 [Rathayibacter sp. AY1C5]